MFEGGARIAAVENKPRTAGWLALTDKTGDEGVFGMSVRSCSTSRELSDAQQSEKCFGCGVRLSVMACIVNSVSHQTAGVGAGPFVSCAPR